MRKRYVFALALSAFLQLRAKAQTNSGFSPQQVIIESEAKAPASVFTIDLDGDGDDDVLIASIYDDKIAWYENDGMGNFGAQQIITAQADGARSVYALDVDGDGDQDVLSASSRDNRIAWYENEGTGAFGNQQIITNQANNARDVYGTDLDGDGDQDVLSASGGDDKIAWYENDGEGNFGDQRIITTLAEGAQSVYAVDLDNDGDQDVLSASYKYGYDANKIAWYENDGHGNFSDLKIISTQVQWANTVYATDLDGDGDQDVLSASRKDNKVAWYENDGQGNFGDQQIITTLAEYARDVYAADLDGDGDEDVLSTSYSSSYDTGNVFWYENDGNGNFGNQQVVTTYAQWAVNVHAADLDSDGDLDILSASKLDNKVAWYTNDGNGTFGTQQILTNRISSPTSVYATDLDGDQNLDIVLASNFEPHVTAYKNDGQGNFERQQIIAAHQAQGANSIYATDLDSDGDQDILTASAFDSKIAWYENDGFGNFGIQQVITTQTNGARSVYTADLDGDGDQDVLSASYRDDKVAWYENTSNGNFGNQQIITLQADEVNSVYCVDLDGDGDQDVISASGSLLSENNKIAWYENDGTGSFGVQQIISAQVNGPYSIFSTDLDNDGDQDVLSTSVYIGKPNIVWYENDGSGIFGAQQVITTQAGGARSVYATDLDGDGDQDVLSASSNKIAWYENNGKGSFSEQTVITSLISTAFSVFAADLDGDGDLDVISASSNDDKVAWYENLLDTIPLVITGLATDKVAREVQVYPNAFTNELFVKTGQQKDKVQLRLYSILGRTILAIPASKITKTETGLRLDTSTLHSGHYILQILDSNGISAQHIVKKQ